MSDVEIKQHSKDLVLEYQLDDPPEKVWRAISIPEFREKWLPWDALSRPESVSSVPGEEVCYRMRDDEPPYLESEVRFQIRPNTDGGTALRIIHTLTDERLSQWPLLAANDDYPTVMRAA